VYFVRDLVRSRKESCHGVPHVFGTKFAPFLAWNPPPVFQEDAGIG
jgi:hypothetical protein